MMNNSLSYSVNDTHSWVKGIINLGK